MSDSLARTLERVRSIKLAVLLGLIPVFFLPITQDFYDTNKWMLVIVVSISCLMLWAVRVALARSFSLSLSPATIGFGITTVAVLLSTVISSANKFEALVAPFGLATFLAFTSLFLFRHESLAQEGKRMITAGILLSAAIASLVSV